IRLRLNVPRPSVITVIRRMVPGRAPVWIGSPQFWKNLLYTRAQDTALSEEPAKELSGCDSPSPAIISVRLIQPLGRSGNYSTFDLALPRGRERTPPAA